MEAWDLCLTSNHQSLDFDWPCPCLDYLNPLLCDNAIDMIPESALINHPYSICNELCFDKDLSNWTDEFLSDGKADEMPIKAENVTANSPVAGSSHSGLEEEHSEICVEHHQVERSNGKDNKKTSEIVKSKKRKKCTEKGPKYAFMTRSMEDIVEDGYKWRKYGTKIIKSKPYPRSYYKCSASNCGVKKTVERDPNDPTMLITTYEGNHNHESPSVIYYIGKPIVFQQPGSMPPLCFSMLDSTLRF